MIGAEAKGLETEWGHYGKSSLSIGVGNYSIGAESKTYETFDGIKYDKSQSTPAIGWSIGGEIGVIVSAHANVSISFSGIYDNFMTYGKERKWWQ